LLVKLQAALCVFRFIYTLDLFGNLFY
jgi:hypothetical protein